MAEANTLWLLDLGNTRLKFGRCVAGRLREVFTWNRDELTSAVRWLQTQEASAYALMTTVAEEDLWLDSLNGKARVWRYLPGAPLPFAMDYKTPHSLGVDRLAAVAGAQAIYPDTDCLVVSAGTCITVEHLYAEARYAGGSISPGLSMRLKAMHTFTSRLPEADLVLPEGEVGQSTQAALQLGAIRGAAFEIAGWWQQFQKGKEGLRQNPPTQSESNKARLLICGGDAPLLHPLLPIEAEHRPYLLLEGLAQLYAYALVE